LVPIKSRSTSSFAYGMVALLAAGPGARQAPYPEPRDFHTFYLALLTKGPAWTAASTPEAQTIQQEHLAHLSRLAADGSLLIAGPIGDDGDLRGVCVLKAKSLDDAKTLEQADPAVKAGRLRVELLTVSVAANWYVLAPIKQDMPLRQFVFGFLTSGSAPMPTPLSDAEIEAAHLSHLWSMRQAGTLVLGGPISDAGVRRELLVFAVDTLDKAKTMAEADPSVKSGRLIVDLHPWFAADGVMQTAK
jgi:uncharacterized protein YciI